jgi:hypothetical protein
MTIQASPITKIGGAFPFARPAGRTLLEVEVLCAADMGKC